MFARHKRSSLIYKCANNLPPPSKKSFTRWNEKWRPTDIFVVCFLLQLIWVTIPRRPRPQATPPPQFDEYEAKLWLKIDIS